MKYKGLTRESAIAIGESIFYEIMECAEILEQDKPCAYKLVFQKKDLFCKKKEEFIEENDCSKECIWKREDFRQK